MSDGSRATVTESEQQADTAPTAESWTSRLVALFTDVKSRRQRFAGFLGLVEAERTRLAGENVREPWAVAARDLVAQAESAAARGDEHEGWDSANRALQYLILGRERQELVGAMIGLAAEARGKLEISPWRREGILALAKEFDNLGSEPDGRSSDARVWDETDLDRGRALVFQATALRDEGLANHHRRADIVRGQLRWVAAVFVLALVSIALLAAFAELDLAAPLSQAPDSIWLWTFVFGLVGGTMTAFLATARGSAARMPAARQEGYVLALRTLVGGVAGVVSYALQVGGILVVGQGNAGSAIALGFAAGLTERVVTEAVAAISPRGG